MNAAVTAPLSSERLDFLVEGLFGMASRTRTMLALTAAGAISLLPLALPGQSAASIRSLAPSPGSLSVDVNDPTVPAGGIIAGKVSGVGSGSLVVTVIGLDGTRLTSCTNTIDTATASAPFSCSLPATSPKHAYLVLATQPGASAVRQVTVTDSATRNPAMSAPSTVQHSPIQVGGSGWLPGTVVQATVFDPTGIALTAQSATITPTGAFLLSWDTDASTPTGSYYVRVQDSLGTAMTTTTSLSAFEVNPTINTSKMS